MSTSLRDYLTNLECLRVRWVKVIVLLGGNSGRSISGSLRGATFRLMHLLGCHAVPARDLSILLPFVEISVRDVTHQSRL